MATLPRIRSEYRPAQGHDPSAFVTYLPAPGRAGQARRVPLKLWGTVSGECKAALDDIRESSGELGLTLADDHVVVPTGAVGRMQPGMADALGFPGFHEGVITLRANLPADDPNHLVVADMEVAGSLGAVTRTGAYLETRKGRGLLLPRLVAMLDKLEVLASLPPSAGRRDAFVACVRGAFGDDTYALENGGKLYVMQASRLDIIRKPDRHGRLVPEPLLVKASGEPVIDPVKLKEFVEETEDGAFGRVPVYANGRFRTVVSPYVAEGLEWVAKQRAEPTEPFPGPAPDGETGFGEQVVGYVPWIAPRLPFLRSKRPAHIPDAFLAEVQGRTMSFTPLQAADLQGMVADARAEGRQSIHLAGEQVPIETAEAMAGQVEPLVAEIRSRIRARDLDFQAVPDHRDADADGLVPGTGGRGPGAAEKTARDMRLKCKTNYLQVAYHQEQVPREGVHTNRTARECAEGFLSFGTRMAGHQLEAVDWAAERYAAGIPGILLCDEPGLGKTLTGLVAAAWIKAADPSDLPVLVVVPPDAHNVWPDEATKHLANGALGKPYVATGGRLNVKGGPGVAEFERMHRHKWVVTTYQALRDHHLFFSQIRWAAVILDEAQLLKNPTTKVRNAVFALRAAFRLLLTGTPVENMPEDIWSLIDIACPGRFGSLKDFVSQAYDGDKLKPGFIFGLSEMLLRPESGMSTVLRRCKDTELDGLPPKVRHLQSARMPPEQAAFYAETFERYVRKGGHGGGFAAMWHLGMVSLHPEATMTLGSVPSKEQARAWIARSARTELAYQAMLPAVEAGEKVVVVLNARDAQPTVTRMLLAALGLPDVPCWLNADIGKAARRERIRKFRDTPGAAVLVITPRIGGLGHTFTEARHVVHLTRWPNPATELQVEDRTHRMGQSGEVQVYVPQAVYEPSPELSIDLWMERLHESKRGLARDFLMPESYFDFRDDLYRDLRNAA